MKLKMTRHSIQLKLTITFLLVLLPLIATSLFANYYSQRVMYDQIYERTRGALLTTLEYVDQLVRNMDQQTLLISTNPNLVDVWKGNDSPLEDELLYDVHVVQQQLSAFTNINSIIQEAAILHGESGTGVSTLQGSMKWENISEEKWFADTVKAGGALVVHIPLITDSNTNDHLKQGHIYFTRSLDFFNGGDESNIIMLVVDKSSIEKTIQNLYSTTNTDISLYYNGLPIIENVKQSSLQNSDFYIEEQFGNWSIKFQQSKKELFEQPESIKKITYLIILISGLLAIIIAWFVYNEISKPLHIISSALKKFSSGMLSFNIKHNRKDEFGYLMNSFNAMAMAQKQLIENDYEKELRLARSEFTLLQSQINPHFLYNTLDLIYSVAIKNNITEISEMVMNLARFFRSSLGKGRETFTVEETITHLNYYIRVQQIRLIHFTVAYEIDEDTKNIEIVKLILQPIVENAIVHGLGRMVYDGELIVRAKLVADDLHIEVEDSGVGIEGQELMKIHEQLAKITSKFYLNDHTSDYNSYYGLKNVKSRLKFYYGETADLLIESKPGIGTKTTLIIPGSRRNNR
ncbi:hypothetical protein BK133_11530 [Paenibacillus sp. FSL H8-0548]|uniref:sensor histidine kinase n=1 Tax=Paenibacillus sp. FSL H8-0548 TaxID=1920422 RepID=UPI00096D7094|nr:histidine kinase [Paenibacillus sp. FSL H8-0548]OMF34635.1 hypothetical protein BK133_11530 [Paenibacillus sp. FSL H8-0548]